MAYERVNWENLPSKNTPVNADNLNKMDAGIANAVEKTGDTMTGGLLFKNNDSYEAIRKIRTLNGTDYQLTVGLGANGAARMEFIKVPNNVLSSVEARSDGIYNGVSGKKLVETSDLLNLIYPVGSIYISVNSTNPANLFGGTWEQIKDRFLLACGSTYNAGATGGEATHTLTIAEMPSHNHTWGWRKSAASGNNAWDAAGSDKTGTSSDIIGSTGGGKPHNNMPPYLAVYMWKRTK